MIKEIKVGKIDVKLKSSAAIPRLYRQRFGKDVIAEMNRMFDDIATAKKINRELQKKSEKEGTEFTPLEEGLTASHIETLETLTYIMHKYADPSQPEDIIAWLDQFGITEVYELFAETIEMWDEENKTLSTPQKKTEI